MSKRKREKCVEPETSREKFTFIRETAAFCDLTRQVTFEQRPGTPWPGNSKLTLTLPLPGEKFPVTVSGGYGSETIYLDEQELWRLGEAFMDMAQQRR